MLILIKMVSVIKTIRVTDFITVNIISLLCFATDCNKTVEATIVHYPSLDSRCSSYFCFRLFPEKQEDVLLLVPGPKQA